MDRDWIAAFPALAALEPAAAARFAREARAAALPAGTVLFRAGELCRAYLMALAGCVRVRLLADSGHEVELYRVERGQTCILTTSCLLAGAAYSAEGIVEQEVAALSLPRPAFEALTAESPVFRRFVFQAFGQRLADLMLLVNEIAFRRVDRRIAQWLDRSAGPGGALPVTHQRIADELGTAREVVSRQLKEFERRGWLRLGRGSIEIGDRAALAAFGRDAD